MRRRYAAGQGRPYDGSGPIKAWAEQADSRSKIPDKFVTNAIERCVRVLGSRAGTGVIIETGLVISNFHLVGEQNSVNEHPAEVIHLDIRIDLVAFRASTRRLRRIQFQYDHFKTQQVFYVGNPEKWNKTVTPGTVVWHKKSIIQTSNPPAEGMSGSGLYDKSTGALIGVVDSMVGSEENGCNFTVAVPARIVEKFYKEALYNLRFRRE